MISLKPVLHVTRKSPDSICLKRGENTTDSLWTSTVFWWLETRNSKIDPIEIPVNEFLTKLTWLRSYWVKQGGTVLIDEDTRKLLDSAKNELDLFKVELRNDYDKAIQFDDSFLKRSLRSFQKQDVSRLVNLKSGANFSVPGAGKTSTTLTIWDTLRKVGTVDKLIVIAPKSAHESWEIEPENIFHHQVNVSFFDDAPVNSNTDILLVNYEKLEKSKRIERLKKWILNHQGMLVLDEAHRIKGGVNSVRWRACKELSVYAKRVDLLSGTPMPQSFDDLRNLFTLSWPNVPRSYLSDSVLSSLKRGSIFVRTTKDELELPPINIYPIYIKQGDLQAEIYSALRKAYVGTFQLSYAEESYFGSKGRAVMTLLATASNPGLLAGINRTDAFLGLEWPPRDISFHTNLLTVVDRYASHEMPPKYKWIRERCHMAQLEGRKVLIWSNFIGNINALSRVLEPLNPAVVYGATGFDERKTEINRFRTDPKCTVLISNPQTLGEGVSLHMDCHEAIYLDRSYNAGHYLQSLDRIHRLGLPEGQITDIYILQSVGTIDQRVAARLDQKIERLSRALNDDSLVKNSLPDETLTLPDEVLGIDQFDLDDLFQHLMTDE